MEYYVWMLVIILLLAHWQISGHKYVYGENRNGLDLSLLLPCLVLFFFAAMRAVTVGADTKQYRLIKKYSSDGWLSIFLFFTLGFYQTALNLTPSAIASLIALGGLGHLSMIFDAKWQNFCVRKSTYANAGISTRFFMVSPAAMISLP